MEKNAIVGQSGGPTSVINGSLAGVFQAAKRLGAKTVYGMVHGIDGLLDKRVVDLGQVLKNDLDIELLKRTPSSFLGSCRCRLPDAAADDTPYRKLLDILQQLDIGYFFYIGGKSVFKRFRIDPGVSDHAHGITIVHVKQRKKHVLRINL